LARIPPRRGERSVDIFVVISPSASGPIKVFPQIGIGVKFAIPVGGPAEQGPVVFGHSVQISGLVVVGEENIVVVAPQGTQIRD